MAEITNRLPQNAPGAYYVDSTCIDCDLCRSSVPAFFKRDEQEGISFVFSQPSTSEEIALAEKAKEACPTGSIGNDGFSNEVFANSISS
jgi:ferredoxin